MHVSLRSRNLLGKAVFATGMVLAIAVTPIFAATTNITVYPNQVTDGTAAVAGSDACPGGNWGSGSWKANGASYSKVDFSPQALFGRDVKISELASISYYTKKGTVHNLPGTASDWFFQMYTKPFAAGTWYGYRINSEPYFSDGLTETAGAWNQWQTGVGANRLRFFNSVTNFGTYQDGFLSDLTSNATYKDQYIMSFGVGTGSGWAAGFTGQIDGLSIVLTNGDTANVNFEAVPEPSSLLALCSLIAPAGFLLRRKK